MSRFRLTPTVAQQAVLRDHCAHARFVWNLAIEQESWWRPGRCGAPGYLEQARQLTEARREFGSWRKAGRDEGFRIVAVRPEHVRRLSRNTGEVWIPKAGWVRFRWSRATPTAKSYRVTLDRGGRWHLAFAAIPEPIHAPGTGVAVGVDRGVAVSAALSSGEMLTVPRPSPARQRRVRRLHRKLARAEHCSKRRGRVRIALAKVRAREADVRKDWAEKTSTDLARRFDVIWVEDLRVASIARSARGSTAKPGRNVRQKPG
jgi:putative transposase